MAAYLIGRMSICDRERYEEYKRLTPAIIDKFGGRFLIRGGERYSLEGLEDDRRVVIAEFRCAEDVRRFYESPEYTAARELRRHAAENVQLMVVAGYEGR